MKHTGRAAVALLLLASGYLAALALGLVALVAVLVVLVSGPSVATVAALVVPLLALLALTRLALRVRRARKSLTAEGVALAQTAQPRLWAEVFSVADRVDSRAPDEIRVVDRVTVELSEDSHFLGLRPGTRRLAIGIPLMLGVSAEQLRVLVAHEFAHDSSRQPGLATHAYRGVAAVRRLRAALGSSISDRLLVAVGKAVEGWAAPAVRDQELGADRIAAELFGSRTAIAALKELGPLEEAWQEFCDNYVLPGALVGLRPTGVFDGFVEFLDDETRQSWMEAYESRHPVAPSTAPGHPTRADRITALKELTTSRQLDFSGAAEDVLDRLDVVLDALESAVTADADLRPAPFDRLVPKATAARVAAQVSALGTAARQLDQWPLEESALLQMVRAGRAAPLLRALAPDADGEELDRLAGTLVADLAAQRLVEAGNAAFTMTWAAAPALSTHGGDLLDPWSVAARASRSPEGHAELEEWLAEYGVRLGRRSVEAQLPEADPDETAPDDQATPVITGRPASPAEELVLLARVGGPPADSAAPAPLPEAPAEPDQKPARPRTSPRDLMTVLMRRVAGPDAADTAANPRPQDAGPAAAPAVVTVGGDRAQDAGSGAEAAPGTGETSDAAAPDPAQPDHAQPDPVQPDPGDPGPNQRQALKSALKELDRLRRAQEQAEREAAEREANAAREAAEHEANAAREAAEHDAAEVLHDETTDPGQEDAEPPDPRTTPSDEHDADEPPPPVPVLNPDLAAAIAALAGASPAEAARPEPAADTELDGRPSTLPGATSADQPAAVEPAAAFVAERPVAGPVAEELTGVLAAAAPISGSARGTLVVSPVGISLRRPDVTDKLRQAKQRAATGAALLTRATGLSVNELTAHRRTHTLSWADITRAEFSGLSEDKGVLTLYVGTRPAQRVEFLSTTEIQGDLLGALESLLGPRLRVS